VDLTLPSLPELVPERLRRSRLLQPRYPGIALEVRSTGVIGVRLRKVKGRQTLTAHEAQALSPGVVGSAPLQPVVEDAGRLEFAVRGILEKLGSKGASRISLGLPDSLARVVVIELPEAPRRDAQAKEMIHWKVRRTIPFRVEDAVISYQMLAVNGSGCKVLAEVAHRRAVRQFERLFEDLGVRVGLVDLASFNVYNALRGAIGASLPAESDVAVLNVTEGYFTLMIFRGDRPLFYRSKPYHVSGGFQGPESLRVVQRELRSSLSYYVDKLSGTEIALTYLRAVGVEHAALAEVLSAVGLGQLERADAQLSVDGLDQLEPDVADALLPAVGLALGRS
jgi:hypothetical protein